MTDEQVTVRDYIEGLLAEKEKHRSAEISAVIQRISDLERLIDSRIKAQDMAVLKAETTSNHRLNEMNNFREALKEQSGAFATRTSLEELSRRIGAIENRLSNIDGRIVGYSAGVGAIVLIISIVAQLLNLGGG